MPSRNESMRARERLQSATPICDDASLLKLDEEVAEYVREANRREADELFHRVARAIEHRVVGGTVFLFDGSHSSP
jgi:hypothetical protein